MEFLIVWFVTVKLRFSTKKFSGNPLRHQVTVIRDSGLLVLRKFAARRHCRLR